MDILTGLGLSGAAGLNAYLPLLMMSVMHRLGWLELSAPYDGISDWPIMGMLAVLLAVELMADKIALVDNVNDLINTVIRPLAGAILFSASTGSMNSVDPTLLTAASLLSGSTAAGGVHTIKASIRPAITLATAGIGNIFMSLFENVVSAVVALLAILLPFFIIFFAMSAIVLGGWILWDMSRVRRHFGPTYSGSVPIG